MKTTKNAYSIQKSSPIYKNLFKNVFWLSQMLFYCRAGIPFRASSTTGFVSCTYLRWETLRTYLQAPVKSTFLIALLFVPFASYSRLQKNGRNLGGTWEEQSACADGCETNIKYPCFVNFFDKNNLFLFEKRKKSKKYLHEHKNKRTFAVSYNNSTLIKI